VAPDSEVLQAANLRFFPSKGDGKGDGNRFKPKAPPADGKPIYEGRVVRLNNKMDAAFVKCEETFAIYGKDVYMWNSYFKQCYLQDVVRFKVHVGNTGMPQVTWLEKISGPSEFPTSSFSDGLFTGQPAPEAGAGVPRGMPTAPPQAPNFGGFIAPAAGVVAPGKAPGIADYGAAPGIADYSAGYSTATTNNRFAPY
jgi:hypothetical protein